ncbi:MAG TPA: FKBP-type peptidyl-prolyl cis-trans isomerase N-terminal domain-containing protein, partial [Sphingobacterium sp.]|nr:FKBP-type peptidyl-prolyl cis-trans isomerase N-terminal domain-containing protein [Sphingobacterium sp.]
MGYAQTANKQSASAQKPAQGIVTLKTDKDSLSYALGMDIAKTLKTSEFDIALSTLFKGLEAAYNGTETL